MKGLTFTLGELAGRVTGGNLAAMAKMLNDAGAAPRLDEKDPVLENQKRAGKMALPVGRVGDSG